MSFIVDKEKHRAAFRPCGCGLAVPLPVQVFVRGAGALAWVAVPVAAVAVLVPGTVPAVAAAAWQTAQKCRHFAQYFAGFPACVWASSVWASACKSSNCVFS